MKRGITLRIAEFQTSEPTPARSLAMGTVHQPSYSARNNFENYLSRKPADLPFYGLSGTTPQDTFPWTGTPRPLQRSPKSLSLPRDVSISV